jgi:hypothetical protein
MSANIDTNTVHDAMLADIDTNTVHDAMLININTNTVNDAMHEVIYFIIYIYICYTQARRVSISTERLWACMVCWLCCC